MAGVGFGAFGLRLALHLSLVTPCIARPPAGAQENEVVVLWVGRLGVNRNPNPTPFINGIGSGKQAPAACNQKNLFRKQSFFLGKRRIDGQQGWDLQEMEA